MKRSKLTKLGLLLVLFASLTTIQNSKQAQAHSTNQLLTQLVKRNLHQTRQPLARKHPRKVKTLHCVWVFDTQATNSVNLGIQRDLENWTTNFTTIGKALGLKPKVDVFPALSPQESRNSHPTLLTGNYVNREQILASINSLDVTPGQDGILFLYSGHGVNTNKGHAVSLANGQRMLRSEIRDALQEKNARLTMMITDSCAYASNWQLGQLQPEIPDGKSAEMCKQLFFHHEGLVDINACAPGQVAFADRFRGGFMSNSLRRLLYGVSEKSPFYSEEVQTEFERLEAENAWEDVTWTKFSEYLAKETIATAKFRKVQQTPHFFELPGGFVGATLTGPSAEGDDPLQLNGRGVIVVNVQPNSPAAASGFRSFDADRQIVDVITHVNRLPIRNAAGFEQAIDRSSGTVDIQVFNPADYSTRTIRVRLTRKQEPPSDLVPSNSIANQISKTTR